MKQNQRSRTPLFLMEIVIMLLVFSVSAGICLKVFAGAKKISQESQMLDLAVLEAQKAAEYWQATKGDVEATATYLQGEWNQDGIVVTYDADWKKSAAQPVFTLRLESDGAVADIYVFSQEETIFHLQTEAVMYGG